MVATVHDIGRETRILVVDDFMDEADLLRAQGIAMAPFEPEAKTYYPGLRRIITDNDSDTREHVHEAMNALAPLMHQVFGVNRLTATEATFCLVTKRAEALDIVQHIPHVDHVDPKFFAFLHFLSPTPQGGTSFYRHRATGYERLDANRVTIYEAALARELALFGPQPVAFIGESTGLFERIGFFEGIYNRLLIYQGANLHSGFIPPDFVYSDDPATGRLTFNIFVQGE